MPNEIDIAEVRNNLVKFGYIDDPRKVVTALLDEIERLQEERDYWHGRSCDETNKTDAAETEAKIQQAIALDALGRERKFIFQCLAAEAERDALAAQGDELEAQLKITLDLEQTERLRADALEERLEMIRVWRRKYSRLLYADAAMDDDLLAVLDM